MPTCLPRADAPPQQMPGYWEIFAPLDWRQIPEYLSLSPSEQTRVDANEDRWREYVMEHITEKVLAENPVLRSSGLLLSEPAYERVHPFLDERFFLVTGFSVRR